MTEKESNEATKDETLEAADKKAVKKDEKYDFLVLSQNDSRISLAEEKNSPPIWLVSFTDVVALMLTFFVLLYSMSNPVAEKWEQKIGGIGYTEGQYSGASNNAGRSEGRNLSRISYAEAENLDYLQGLFAEMADQPGNEKFVKLLRAETFLVLQFNATNIDDDFLSFLKTLTPLLNSLDNHIVLTVHSDFADGLEFVQGVGRLLRADGYEKPLGIQVADAFVSEEGRFAMLIKPDDGRRITR